MEENKKEYNYNVGLYDLICRYIREKTLEGAEKVEYYGIGVFTDRYCEETLMSRPMKTLEQRMEIAKSLEGVDFVFSVDDLSEKDKKAEEAFLKFKQEVQEKREQEEKKFKAGFIIGSFDVFHSGHLENINIAKQFCEKLFIVLKTDERIMQNKKKKPQQSTSERAEILKSIKQIEGILYMDIDTTREDIIEDVLKKCPDDVKKSDIVAIFGSDLKEKETAYLESSWKDINVKFTHRDPIKAQIVSSSNYEEMYVKNGGIAKFEEIEEQANL